MSEKLLDIEIVTPQRKVFVGKASTVFVPGKLSPFQILINHAPIVSALDFGVTRVIEESGEELVFATSPGFVEVSKNNISILVESAFATEEINTEELEAELKEVQTDSGKLVKANEIENCIKACQKYK